MPDTDLLHLITEDIGTAEQLLELINSEFDALSSRDLTRLETLLSEKLPLLNHLDAHGKLRSQTLTQLNLSSDRAGLEAYAITHSQGALLLSQSEILDQLLSQCREANERNARLIRANQTSLKNTLEILRGADTPGLYDSTGNTARNANQRPLSQA